MLLTQSCSFYQHGISKWYKNVVFTESFDLELTFFFVSHEEKCESFNKMDRQKRFLQQEVSSTLNTLKNQPKMKQSLQI